MSTPFKMYDNKCSRRQHWRGQDHVKSEFACISPRCALLSGARQQRRRLREVSQREAREQAHGREVQQALVARHPQLPRHELRK